MAIPLTMPFTDGTPCISHQEPGWWGVWHVLLPALCCLSRPPCVLTLAGDPWTRRYIYNQALCGRCGSKVATWEMAARRVYACQTCQPLPEDTVISPARSKALAASTPTRVHAPRASASGPRSTTPCHLRCLESRVSLRPQQPRM